MDFANSFIRKIYFRNFLIWPFWFCLFLSQMALAKIDPLPFVPHPFPYEPNTVQEKYQALLKAYQDFWAEVVRLKTMPDPYSDIKACPYENRSYKILGLFTQNVSTPPLFMRQWRSYYDYEYDQMYDYLKRVSCQLPGIEEVQSYLDRLYLDACIVYTHDQVCKTGHMEYYCKDYYPAFDRDYYTSLDKILMPYRGRLSYSQVPKGQSIFRPKEWFGRHYRR